MDVPSVAYTVDCYADISIHEAYTVIQKLHLDQNNFNVRKEHTHTEGQINDKTLSFAKFGFVRFV